MFTKQTDADADDSIYEFLCCKSEKFRTVLILPTLLNSLTLESGNCRPETEVQNLFMSLESPPLFTSFATRQQWSSVPTPKFLNADDIWFQTQALNKHNFRWYYWAMQMLSHKQPISNTYAENPEAPPTLSPMPMHEHTIVKQ